MGVHATPWGWGQSPPAWEWGHLQHGAVTFGDSTQPAWPNTSAASKRMKPPKSGALPSFLGWTGLCLLGRASTTGKNADAGKSSVPWGGRACPADYFWFVSPALEPLIYAGVSAVTKGSAAGLTSSRTRREGRVALGGPVMGESPSPPVYTLMPIQAIHYLLLMYL